MVSKCINIESASAQVPVRTLQVAEELQDLCHGAGIVHAMPDKQRARRASEKDLSALEANMSSSNALRSQFVTQSLLCPWSLTVSLLKRKGSRLRQPSCNKSSLLSKIEVGDLKMTSTSIERQKRSQNLALVPVIISGNSLVFSRKIITSTGFHRCCAPGTSAPVVVKN